MRAQAICGGSSAGSWGELRAGGGVSPSPGGAAQVHPMGHCPWGMSEKDTEELRTGLVLQRAHSAFLEHLGDRSPTLIGAGLDGKPGIPVPQGRLHQRPTAQLLCTIGHHHFSV